MDTTIDGPRWVEKMQEAEGMARVQWRPGDVLPGWDPFMSDANQFYTDLIADCEGNVPEIPPNH